MRMEKPEPAIESALTVTGDVPVEVMVRDLVDAEPTVTLPKPMVDELKVS